MNTYDFVIALVKDAGEILLRESKKAFAVTTKNNDPKDIVTTVDILVNDFLISALKKEYPSYGIYSEEGESADSGLGPELLRGEYVWVIDPIDGTSNFSRHIPHFAICVGLLHRNIPILGVVYNPVTRELFSFEKGKGAFLNGERIEVLKTKELKDANILFHAGRKPELWQWGGDGYAKLLAHARKVGNYGGSALDACFVAAGRFEGNVYGRLSTMDIASALGILYEAGGVAVGVDGKPISISKDQQKVFMANNQEMADKLVSLLG